MTQPLVSTADAPMLTPRCEAEVVEIVREAGAKHQPLAIAGGKTRAIGRPVQAAADLSLRDLSGIVFHEPAEMVIRALAGTPVAQIEAALADKGQMLPFEPMDHRGLLGTRGEPTIGGVAAANVSGPRRIQAGAARDSLIGIRLVNGRAEAIQSGGRVMKNVTGLDLVKLACGAMGTLGPLTEVTFKVLPRPEEAATLVVEGLSDADGIGLLCAALGSPYDVSGAAHLPAGIGAARSRTLVRVEGFAFSVAHRLAALAALPGFTRHAPQVLRGEGSADLWRSIRDVAPFDMNAAPGSVVWRVSVAPTRGPHLTAALACVLPGLRWFHDWGGGLVWLAVPAGQADGGAAAIRNALTSLGGHATLVRAPVDLRLTVPVFQPQPAPVAALEARVRASFDPAGLFNPGLMTS
jgi:glycolate oxidase FAD binding subunit